MVARPVAGNIPDVVQSWRILSQIDGPGNQHKGLNRFPVQQMGISKEAHGMWDWLQELDRILRGDATRLSALRQGTIDVPVFGLSVMIVALGMLYGLCMGCFAIFSGHGASLLQVAASMVKVPLLFGMTFAVTFPSLYVFNALVGSRLSGLSLLRLMVAGGAVMLAVLASLGPIVAFFSVSSTSYPFLQILNVVTFGVAGFLGLKFLLLTLHRMTIAQNQTAALDIPEIGDDADRPTGALEKSDGQVFAGSVKSVFRMWVLVFGLVGSQMGWMLRPFIGSPDVAFTFFRTRDSNIFEAVLGALGQVLGLK